MERERRGVQKRMRELEESLHAEAVAKEQVRRAWAVGGRGGVASLCES